MASLDPSRYMELAIAEAEAAAARDEVPIGAVVVDPGGSVVAAAGNRTRELKDPSAHAEILAIRAACAAAGSERIPGYDLYVTLEPCAMCAAAMSFARIRRLTFAASDPKSGGVDHGARVFSHATCHHRPEVAKGVFADVSSVLLKSFFAARR